MPQISVIIPVYNAQKTLEKCLAGIFSQSFKNYEIIAVNDGSSDKSQDILKKYRKKITVISQKNKGAGAARNAGAKIAKGRFLIFCDADVMANPLMLEKMYSALKKYPTISYAYSSFKFGFKTFRLWPFSVKKLKEMPYIHTTSLIRREHFPGFDKKLKRFQDWDLWLTMLARDHIGHFIPEVLFKVISGGTMSFWLPKIFYKFPWSKKVKKYKSAERIVKRKHQLT